jgi:acetyltransferase EpsM
VPEVAQPAPSLHGENVPCGPMSERSLLICGARSFSHEVADVVQGTSGLKLIGFVENEQRELCPGTHAGLPLHWIDDVGALAGEAGFVCAFGTTHRSHFTAQMEALGFAPETVVHPAAHVSPRSVLGPGCIVLPGVVVGAHTRVGRHVLLSRGALVGHHSEIGDHTSVLPGANVAGHCTVGAGVYVGMGAIVLNGVSVGAMSVIGAGAVVTRDVPERAQVVGIPARVVKEGVDGR